MIMHCFSVHKSVYVVAYLLIYHMLSHLGICRMKLASLWWIVFLICSWVMLGVILLRIVCLFSSKRLAYNSIFCCFIIIWVLNLDICLFLTYGIWEALALDGLWSYGWSLCHIPLVVGFDTFNYCLYLVCCHGLLKLFTLSWFKFDKYKFIIFFFFFFCFRFSNSVENLLKV